MFARFVSIGVVVLLATGCTSGLQVGAVAPAFDGTDASGNQISLAAYEGQVLILDFFGVW